MSLIFFIVWYTSFKFSVRIREIVSGRTVLSSDRAKRIKDRDGVYWWRFRRLRVKIPEIPSECIDITTKGKKTAEVFRADDGSFIPIQVKFNYDDFKKKEVLKSDPDAFRPFPTNQRAMLIHELRESEQYKKKKLSETLLALAPYIAIVLILVIFMVFFGEVVAPSREVSNGLILATEKIQSSMNVLSETCLGRVKLQVQNITAGTTPPN